MMTDEIFNKESITLSEQLRTLLSDKPVLIHDETCTFTTINDIVVSTVNFKPEVKVLLSNGKQFALFTGLHTGTLTLDAETYDNVLTCEAEANKLATDLRERAIVANTAAREAKLAAEEQEKQERKADAKQAALKRNALHLADVLDASDPFICPDNLNNFYLSLGYLARHARTVSAVLPDYLESWFVKNFGDASKRVVDSSKRTVNGNSMQWSLGLTLSLDTNDNIPVYLQQYLTQQNKKVKYVANTPFVFSLVRDYGFTFGKKQDIDKIRQHIPDSQLTSFELGYALGVDS